MAQLIQKQDSSEDCAEHIIDEFEREMQYMTSSVSNRVRCKLKSSSGESLTETLVAVLVMCLAMMVISGSIVTAAKINAKAADMDTATMLNGTRESGSSASKTTASVTITQSGTGTGSTASVDVELYTDKASGTDYYFYESK